MKKLLLLVGLVVFYSSYANSADYNEEEFYNRIIKLHNYYPIGYGMICRDEDVAPDRDWRHSFFIDENSDSAYSIWQGNVVGLIFNDTPDILFSDSSETIIYNSDDMLIWHFVHETTKENPEGRGYFGKLPRVYSFNKKNNKIIVDVDRDKGWFNLFLGNKPIIYHKILHTFGLKPKLGWVGSCREISSIEQYKY